MQPATHAETARALIEAARAHAIEVFALLGWKAGDAEQEAVDMIGTGEARVHVDVTLGSTGHAITCRVLLLPVFDEGEPVTIYDSTDPDAPLPAPDDPSAPRWFYGRLKRWRRQKRTSNRQDL